MLKREAESYGTDERNKCVILLLDEMHVRKDLVFDKHSGGFVNLGGMNEQLLDLENLLKSGVPAHKELASTMTSLKFSIVLHRCSCSSSSTLTPSVSTELLMMSFNLCIYFNDRVWL